MAAPVSPAIDAFITKGFWDTEVTARWANLYGAWTAYTPAWTAVTTPPAIANGLLYGAYKVSDTGSTVYVRIRLSPGSSTTLGTGSWSLSLPAGFAPTGTQSIHGFAANAAGSARYPVAGFVTAANGVERMAVDGTTGVSATAPFSWSAGDFLVLTGVYDCS